MTKIELPHINVFRQRGRVYSYYRRDGLCIRIPGSVGTPEWLDAYRRTHESFEATGPQSAGAGTLAALIEAYRAAPDFTQLKPKTRRDYGRYLDRLKEHYGDLKVRAMPRDFIFELRDAYQATPRTANYLLSVLRLILNFAEDRKRRFGLPPAWSNPARRPRQLKTGDGHRPWETYEVDAFRDIWAIGTRQRTAFELLLATGQRGGDVVAMDRRHYAADGWIKVAQEKTGERVEIPASQALRDTLEPWLKQHKNVVILVTDAGRAYKVDHFRHEMRDAYRAAGLPDDCTSHGLRYTAATVLHELGCDWPTIAAITGHKTAEMVRKYTAKKRRAAAAIARLDAAGKGIE